MTMSTYSFYYVADTALSWIFDESALTMVLTLLSLLMLRYGHDIDSSILTAVPSLLLSLLIPRYRGYDISSV
jgi:hypothetical protein